MSTLCSCEGLNENCFKCSGSGFVDDSSPIRTDVGPLIPKSKLARPPERVLNQPPIGILANKSLKQGRQCPKCNAWVIDLSEHHKMVHRIPSKPKPPLSKHRKIVHGISSKPKPPIKPKPPKVPCPHCKSFVRETRLQSHVRKAHAGTITIGRTSKPKVGLRIYDPKEFRPPTRVSDKSPSRVLDKPPIRRPKPKLLMVACPHCPSLVQETRLQSHVRKVHAGTTGPTSLKDIRQSSHGRELDTSGTTMRTSIKNTSRTSHPRKLDNSGNPNLVEKLERKLDATRLYAHAFRDRGQFGSHPNHDDYSDESEA